MNEFEFSEETINLVNNCEYQLQPTFKEIDEVCQFNSLKVLSAFKKINYLKLILTQQLDMVIMI